MSEHLDAPMRRKDVEAIADMAETLNTETHGECRRALFALISEVWRLRRFDASERPVDWWVTAERLSRGHGR